MHTFHAMQAYIPLTEITLFPHHQEQNYVNDIIGGGRGNTQISSKNFKIVCKLLCTQVSQPLDTFFFLNTACPLQNIEQKAIEISDSTIYQAWNFSSIMYWLVVVLRVRLDKNTVKGWAKGRGKKTPTKYIHISGYYRVRKIISCFRSAFAVLCQCLFVNTNNNHLEYLFVEKKSGKIIPVEKSMSLDHCHIFKAVPRY